MVKNFGLEPTVNIHRTKFTAPNSRKTTLTYGQIIPIGLTKIYPGDSFKVDLGSLIRMNSPQTDFMDDVQLEIFAFFVPNRLVWDKWKYFIGEDTGAGATTINYAHPYEDIGDNGSPCSSYTLGDYYSLPVEQGTGGASLNNSIRVDTLPLRGYELIYNSWFRDQNVEAPLFLDISASGTTSATALDYQSTPLFAYKNSDYFTRALPYVMKTANPVTFPIGETAPLIAKSTGGRNSLGAPISFSFTGAPLAGEFFASLGVHGNAGTTNGLLEADFDDTSVNFDVRQITATNLYADLKNATSASVTSLVEAIMLQNFYTRDALWGTRYRELIYSHFAVRFPDFSIMDPELLGHITIDIQKQQVLSTNGASGGGLGDVGANSVTGHSGHLYTKSFVEHGWVHVLAVVRQRAHSYSMGVQRKFKEFDRLDLYWPSFENLPAQPINIEELYAYGGSTGTFGYQEAYAHLKFFNDEVTGGFRPYINSNWGMMTLTDNYSSKPTLSTSFLKESRDNWKRVVANVDQNCDFFCDFYFKNTVTRCIKAYNNGIIRI